jgi:hypothetical protein
MPINNIPIIEAVLLFRQIELLTTKLKQVVEMKKNQAKGGGDQDMKDTTFNPA